MIYLLYRNALSGNGISAELGIARRSVNFEVVMPSTKALIRDASLLRQNVEF